MIKRVIVFVLFYFGHCTANCDLESILQSLIVSLNWEILNACSWLMICVIVAYSFKRKLNIDLYIFILNLVIGSFFLFLSGSSAFYQLYKNICYGTKRVIFPPGFTMSLTEWECAPTVNSLSFICFLFSP